MKLRVNEPAHTMNTRSLQIADIETHAGTQIRAKIDKGTVETYAEAMRDAENKFPAVIIYNDGSRNILADGFHRVMAASSNGFRDIKAEVRKGTKADALKYALGANCAHGKPRTNVDKRRSVELALAEWPKLSDRELAKICAVSNQFVSNVRGELSTVDSCEPEQKRTGADGKERKLPSKPATAPVPSPAPVPPHTIPNAPEAEETPKDKAPEVQPEPKVEKPEVSSQEARNHLEAEFWELLDHWRRIPKPAAFTLKSVQALAMAYKSYAIRFQDITDRLSE